MGEKMKNLKPIKVKLLKRYNKYLFPTTKYPPAYGFWLVQYVNPLEIVRCLDLLVKKYPEVAIILVPSSKGSYPSIWAARNRGMRTAIRKGMKVYDWSREYKLIINKESVTKVKSKSKRKPKKKAK
jgi:hypothetical protein